MATRSDIIVKMTDGRYARIYCHNDGYPSYNGSLLLEHYSSQKMAEKLVKLGDISSLGETIGKKHNFDWRMDLYDKYAGMDHSLKYNDPNYIKFSKMCNVYGRDRKEKNTNARLYDTLEAAVDDPNEYTYVWTGEAWTLYETKPVCTVLTAELCKD